MNAKTYCRISATLFTVVAIGHLSRVINGWALQIDGLELPMLISLIAAMVTGALALWGFRESRN